MDNKKIDKIKSGFGEIEKSKIKAFNSTEMATDEYIKKQNGLTDTQREYFKEVGVGNATQDGYARSLAKSTSAVSKYGRMIGGALLNMGVMAVAGFAIDTVIGIVDGVVNYENNLRESAEKYGQAYTDSQANLASYKKEIDTLNETINDPSSSIEETTAARERLLAIQGEMVEMYKNEAGAADLVTQAVNGNTDAYDKLQQREYRKAKNDFIKENDYIGWDKLVSDMTNYETSVFDALDLHSWGLSGTDDWYTSDGINNLTQIDDKYKDILKNVNEIMERNGVLSDEWGNIAGDPFEVQKALEAAKSYIDHELTLDPQDEGLKNSSAQLESQLIDIETIVSQYQALWDGEILNNKIFANDDLKKFYNDILDAQNDYNEALASGDISAIKGATADFANLYNQIEDVSGSDAGLASYFERLVPTMEGIVNNFNFDEAFTEKYSHVKKTLENIGKELAGLTDKEIKQFNKALYDSDQQEAYGKLTEMADEYGVSVDYLTDKLVEMGEIQTIAYRELENKFGDKIKGLSDEDLEFAYGIKNIGDLTFEQLTDKIDRLRKIAENEIDIKARTNLENYKTAQEETANRSDYDTMTTALARGKELYESGEVGSKEFRAIAEMFSYNGMDGSENFIKNYSNIGGYFTEGATGLEKFVNKMTTLKDINGEVFAQFDSGTGQYSLNLQDIEGLAQQMSIPVEGISVMLQALQDYGFTDTYFGSMEDGAALYQNKLSELIEAKEKLAKLKADGNVDTTALEEAESDVENLENRLGIITDGMNALETQSKKTTDSTKEAMESAVQGLQEGYDALNELDHSSVTYEKVKSALESQVAALEAEYGIEIEIDDNNVVQVVDKFSELESKITGYKDALNQLRNANGSLNMEDGETQRIISDLRAAYQEKLKLEAPGIMDIDTSGLIPDVANTVSTIQQMLTLSAQIEADTSVDIDTSSAEARLAELMASLPPEIVTALGFDVTGKTPQDFVNELIAAGVVEIPTEFEQPEAMEVKFSDEAVEITANVNGLEDLGTLQEYLSQIGAITSMPINVNVNVPNTDVLSQVQETVNTINQNGTATVSLKVDGDRSVIGRLGNVQAGLNGIAKTNPKPTVGLRDTASSAISYIKKQLQTLNGFTATTYIRTVNTGVAAAIAAVGGTRASGSAHANGSTIKRAPKISSFSINGGVANATGNWAVEKSEKSLVGEIAPEIIVRNGRFFTVGDNGAEFVDIKRGDIIFNHLQARQLLKNGYVTGRGKMIGGNANVNGSAYFGGSTGGFGQAATSNTAKQATSTNALNKTVTSAAKAVTSTAKKVSEATKDFQETLDGIEIRIDRLSDELSRITTVSSDVEQRYTKQNDMLNTAIDGYLKLFKESQQYYDRYITQANASGLSESYKQLVQSGEIDIKKITDEDLYNKIQDYKEWYDKAQEVNNLIVETQKNLRELANTKMENIKDDFDFIVGRLEELINLGQTRIDLKDMLGQNVTEGDYLDIMGKQGDISRYLSGQYDAMTKEFNTLIANGSITRYSDDWYDWEQQIAAVGTAIAESDQAVKELKSTIREFRWKSFNDGVEQLENLNEELSTTADLIDDTGLFNDKGTLTNQGITKLGLYGQQLSIARKKVAEYKQAMSNLRKELDNGVITQSEYNEYLAEMSKEQQNAVSEVDNYRDAIISLVKNGIEKETEAMNKLIETRKKDLQASKEYNDYADELADKQKAINAKKAQMAAIEGNEKNKSEYAKYQNELQKLQDEYDKLKKDHEYESTISGYDDLLEVYEENQQERLDILDSNLEAQNEAIADALNEAKDSYDEVFAYLGTISEVYGQNLSNNMLNPWKDAASAAAEYSSMIDHINAQLGVNTSPITTMDQTIKDIQQLYQELLGRDADAVGLDTFSKEVYSGQSTLDDIRNKIIGSQEYNNIHGNNSSSNGGGTQPTPDSSQNQSQDSSIWKGIGQDNSLKGNGKLNKDVSIYDRIAWNGYKTGWASQKQLFANLGGSGTYKGSASQNSWMVKELKNRGFAQGGTAKLVKTSGEDGFILGRAGEHIFTPENAALVERLVGVAPKLYDMTTKSMTVDREGVGNVTVTYENLIGNIEYIDKNALPDLQTILKESWKYSSGELKKNAKLLGRR